MSYFGDNTPSQAILEQVKATRDDHNLTASQVVKILLDVLAYFTNQLD